MRSATGAEERLGGVRQRGVRARRRATGLLLLAASGLLLAACTASPQRKNRPGPPDPLGRVTGQKWTEPNSGMEMVFIGAGSFWMGSEKGPENERPVHEVTFPRGFYVGATEVTQAQWERLMRTRPWAGMPGVLELDDAPAVYVSASEADGFAAALNKTVVQRGFHLLTEAEWEYACRAGTEGEYCFGDDERRLADYAWYQANAQGAAGVTAQRVASKQPNVWGLYDMHGNVWEWCGDWYDAKYYASVGDRGFLGPASGSGRVMRGGGWNVAASSCRSAARGSSAGGTRTAYIGFRVARWTYE